MVVLVVVMVVYIRVRSLSFQQPSHYSTDCRCGVQGLHV